MSATELSTLPFNIASLHSAYAQDVTPLSVIKEAIRRIEQVDDPGIFISRLAIEELKTQCDALSPFDPQAYPLWGIPYVAKDNIDVAECVTTAGCPEYGKPASDDAVVVARLRAAGAIVLGKTNLDQFATGLVGTRSPYPVPRNAVDPSLVPGGSSSGSAVSVAHGFVSFSLGTDTAGSGRVPAALNNIVGLKPSLGLISARGVVPACRTLDTVSIFALCVDDAYQVLEQAAAFDPLDPFSRDLSVAPAGGLLIQNLPTAEMPLQHLTIGIPDLASRRVVDDSEHDAMFVSSVQQLEKLGATILPLSFEPFFAVADLLYSGAWIAERYTVIEDLLNNNPDALHPVTRELISAGKTLTAATAFKDRYRLQALKRECDSLMQDVNALCVPSIARLVTRAEIKADPIGPNNSLGRYTNFVNLLDMCGIAVPTTPRRDGRPGSVTLLSDAGRDCHIASIAAALQANVNCAPGVLEKPLPVTRSTRSNRFETGANELAVAAVGAHMSGMPLNGELVKLGARKLRDAQTSASYRLFSLAGGPPARPGLVRDPHGASIALEVWAIPLTNIGPFLAGIPSPLGLGTVTLSDESQVTGFICESAGLTGAQDVTHFGGWRAYIES